MASRVERDIIIAMRFYGPMIFVTSQARHDSSMTVSNARNSGRSISGRAITPGINIYTRRSIYSSRRCTRLLLSLMKTEGARQWRLTRVHNACVVPRNRSIVMHSRRRFRIVTTWARSAFVYEILPREIDPLTTTHNDFRFFFKRILFKETSSSRETDHYSFIENI